MLHLNIAKILKVTMLQYGMCVKRYYIKFNFNYYAYLKI